MNFFGLHFCVDELILIMAAIPIIKIFFRAAKARVMNHTCCDHHGIEVKNAPISVGSHNSHSHPEERRESLPN